MSPSCDSIAINLDVSTAIFGRCARVAIVGDGVCAMPMAILIMVYRSVFRPNVNTNDNGRTQPIPNANEIALATDCLALILIGESQIEYAEY